MLASNSAGARSLHADLTKMLLFFIVGLRKDDGGVYSSMRISNMANVTNLTKAATPKSVEEERMERVMKRRRRHSYESRMAR